MSEQGMNRDFKVDVTNCDREPIHIPGAVQSFGFLLALSSDWLVVRASSNVREFLGAEAATLLGRSIDQVLWPEAVHLIRNRMVFLTNADSAERLFNVDLLNDRSRSFDVAIHLVKGSLVLEAEPAQTDPISLTGTLRNMMTRLDQVKDLNGFFREGARQVRVLTGFDRVMVYRFDDQDAGEVVAESARSGIGSFVGLRYPASDIPVQARALYVKNLFRIIADVESVPAAIVPQRDESGEALDLTLAVTRAVSPIHIEYLKNMRVQASMSISIVIEGRLWGLFACHHQTPRLPGLERRSLAELFGQMFAMKLESRDRQYRTAALTQARLIGDSLLAVLAGDHALLGDPEWLGETLNRAIESDGVGTSIDGRVALAGIAPSKEEFDELIKALNAASASRIYATDRITDLLPAAENWSSQVKGMLSMPISRSPRDYLVLFRQEQISTVRWAGNPNKPVERSPEGDRLTPRKSFESWAETVKGRSRPFGKIEVQIAEQLRATLIEVVLRLSENAHAERQLATDRQELLIAELNHRVRNILTLIGGLVRRSRNGVRSIDDYVRDIDSRIEALARAHNQITQQHWGAAGLRQLIETETDAYFAGKQNHVALSGSDVMLAPQAFSTLALVLHELITNSAKHGSLSIESGRVFISWSREDPGDLVLRWRESGGPAVQAPKHQGFGSTIIRRSIPYDLGGKADIKFNVAGLEATFTVPGRFIIATDLPAGRPAPAAPAADGNPRFSEVGALQGHTVLLVEDSLIIALDTEDHLLLLGAERVVSAASVEQAWQEIREGRPTLAVLDVNLGEQTSLPIAEWLTANGIPFILATGYGERVALPQELGDVIVLQKPYTLDAIGKALSEALLKRQ